MVKVRALRRGGPRSQALATLVIALTTGAAAQAQHGATAITCTNPASGAQWQIRIDYERHTVDAHAATFSDGDIRWHDAASNTNYTLDRKSGNLTVVIPSSTGGYFVHDRCQLER